ncbi:MAG: GNAT family N-acetyltransferase [Clostridia bacterium]|nr:GNAT family N-acetyltransferase [Clostridia bacterium]MBQ4290862.1 GNAT family N-acetyltransferase [Clostridia bacterium]
MPQLMMLWKNEEPTVPSKLAPGCRVIDATCPDYTPEQYADAWNEICTELNGVPWTREHFFERHWNAPEIPRDGIFFAVTPEGRLFSTATVQQYPDHANLHMVGTSMDCKGMGGGRAVCLACVRYFQSHGITRAELLTDDFRIPAIKIYLGLGFRPYLYEPHAEEMKARWEALADVLGIPELPAYDDNSCEVLLHAKAV